MAKKDLTSAQVLAQENTRDARTGHLRVARATQPHYDQVMRMVDHLADSSAPWFKVHAIEGDDDAVGIFAGRAEIDGVILVYAGADPAIATLTNNDTTYIWLQNDGAGAAEIDSAVDATGWPATAHIKLAEVTVAAGVITAIVDRRPETIFKLNQAAAVADLNQTITDPPTQADVQAISDKVDALLASLRAAGILAT